MNYAVRSPRYTVVAADLRLNDTVGSRRLGQELTTTATQSDFFAARRLLFHHKFQKSHVQTIRIMTKSSM